MAENTTMAARPLLRRVLSFREPLLIIPYLLGFLATAASAFFGSYASFLHSVARSSSLFPSSAAKCACAYASPATAACSGDDLPSKCQIGEVQNEEEAEEEEDAPLSRDEVASIMARLGVAAVGRGEGLAAAVGRDDVSRLFDAEEPSFAEVRGAFKVFDADGDGFIGAADLEGALARLGVREDADACRAMIAAAGGGRDGRMSLFQFVAFLETGLH